MIKIIECPRDAMQGISEFIPTAKKVEYINSLLKVGFDTIDFGSFVSPKAVPQMSDTEQVIEQLDLTNSKTKLLAIVANLRGAETAVRFNDIAYLGYPFSVSETFQLKNTNSTIEQSLERVYEMHNLCNIFHKELVVYISMAFGNPYGDVWDAEIVAKWMEKLSDYGIRIIALADTVGVSTIDNISYLFKTLIPDFSHIEIAAHLHSNPKQTEQKISAAYKAGCRRFDTAMLGFGGCPMAEDKLTGNISTEILVDYCEENNIEHNLDLDLFDECYDKAHDVFGIDS
jgi:hydroxymethylglutaryl-CoA lyase